MLRTVPNQCQRFGDDAEREVRAASQPLFYTNAQLKLLMSPDRAPLPYMYDNFAWPHCEMLGYTMSNRLADYGLADDAANATEAETVYAFDFKAQCSEPALSPTPPSPCLARVRAPLLLRPTPAPSARRRAAAAGATKRR